MNRIETKRDECGYVKSGFGNEKAAWFVDYDLVDGTTALVVCGSDGIGVLFLVLRGNKTEEFAQVANKYEKSVFGALGECIRFAAQHEDLIPERCTIGGIFSSKLKFSKIN